MIRSSFRRLPNVPPLHQGNRMNVDLCILDVIARSGITFPPAAVPSSIRPRVANDSPPANYVMRRPRFRPDRLIDAYLATRPGSVAAVNALSLLMQGVDASECQLRPAAERRLDAIQFANDDAGIELPDGFGKSSDGKRSVDDPTPDEIRRRCEAIQAGWADEEFAVRASACLWREKTSTRKAMASAG